MKKIQFSLQEDVYDKAKKRLKQAGLTWQTVCKQMSDHIICSEHLDEWGLPLQEMTPSIFKKTQSEMEGHFETALWKYIQIQMDEKHRNHWMSALKAALKQVIKSNSSKGFKRGYVFDEDELSEIMDSMWGNGMKLASDHLELPIKDLQWVEKPTFQELFTYADLIFSLKKKIK